MGENAAPQAAPAMIRACTQPCEVIGIQLAAILPLAGYTGAAATPNRNRTTRKEGTTPKIAPSPGLPHNAVSPVRRAVPSTLAVSTRRGPKTSVSQPPG